MKKQANKSSNDNSRTALNTSNLRHLNTRFLARMFIARLHLSILSRYACSIKFRLCFTFCWILHVYKSDVSVAVFETCWPPHVGTLTCGVFFEQLFVVSFYSGFSPSEHWIWSLFCLRSFLTSLLPNWKLISPFCFGSS